MRFINVLCIVCHVGQQANVKLARYKLHVMVVSVVLVAVHAGLFILLQQLIKQQRQLVQRLYWIGGWL